MKIALNPNHMFWGLMNPVTLQLTLSLTDVHRSTEIDETKLHPWELNQIIGSVKRKKISISVQLEDLIKSVPATPDKKAKKVTKKVAESKPKE